MGKEDAPHSLVLLPASPSKDSTTTPASIPQVHCWECQRRRLVCDSKKPICGRCEKSGVACPGYGDKKPLRWLAPGNVAFNRRRKRLVVPVDSHFLPVKVPKSQRKPPKKKEKEEPVTTLVIYPELKLQPMIEKVVQAVEYCMSVPFHPSTTPPWRTLTCVIAVNYSIFPIHQPVRDMICTTMVDTLELGIVKYFPPAMRHIFVAMAIGHHIHLLPSNVDPKVISSLWGLFYTHRGQAIEAVTEDISSPDKRRQFTAIPNVVLLLSLDVCRLFLFPCTLPAPLFLLENKEALI